MFKSFFPKSGVPATSNTASNFEPVHEETTSKEAVDITNVFSVRVAVYDSFTTSPRTFDLSSSEFSTLVEQIAAQVYTHSHEKGGTIPYIVLREAIENLIHANFKNAVITVMPDGNTIKISDHGPGISDKNKVFLPGFSTADEEARKYIKGVGSGLPIVNESLKLMGGQVTIEDNLKEGSVITLSMNLPKNEQEKHYSIPDLAGTIDVSDSSLKKQDLDDSQSNVSEPSVMKIISANIEEESIAKNKQRSQTPKEIDNILSIRQKKVFLLIAEMGEIGPSTVTKELEMSLSTAYRDLVTLEEMGLVLTIDNGKRKVTNKGIEYLGFIFA